MSIATSARIEQLLFVSPVAEEVQADPLLAIADKLSNHEYIVRGVIAMVIGMS
jgi:hypothetical protein